MSGNTAAHIAARHDLDTVLEELIVAKQDWARTSVAERIDVLAEIRDNVVEVAKEWVLRAASEKQIPDGSPLVGEEWLSGPHTIIAACNGYIDTLSQLADKAFVDKLPVRTVGADQIAVRVIPHSIWDRLLLSGIQADVWMETGVGQGTLKANTASTYDIPIADREGSVSLVLGAGNIAAIAPLDCFHKLFVEHSVAILKLNPVNDYLKAFLDSALRPLIERGALRVVTGDAGVGAYLCEHPAIDSIHITGAGASHDAIVWGAGEEGRRNKAAGTPRNTKSITSELGAVCPTIIVPGRWTKADICFQAEHIATQKLHNSGFNCVACQMLIVPEDWDQRDEFIAAVNAAMARTPARGLYYPGASERVAEFRQQYPEHAVIEAKDGAAERTVVPFRRRSGTEHAEAVEVFAPLLSVTTIPGSDVGSFLRDAIDYCNEHLHGTLGANIIIDPKTRAEIGAKWDDNIRDLRYGCIAINAWTGLGFLSVQTPWGAFPGHTLDDVQSGIGFVHNTYLFDKPERCVIEAPFRPFPRNLLHGSFTLLPKPPWFVSNRKADKLGSLLTKFQHKPGFLKIPRIFLNALLG